MKGGGGFPLLLYQLNYHNVVYSKGHCFGTSHEICCYLVDEEHLALAKCVFLKKIIESSQLSVKNMNIHIFKP
jgi:hypothetical protein